MVNKDRRKFLILLGVTFGLLVLGGFLLLGNKESLPPLRTADGRQSCHHCRCKAPWAVSKDFGNGNCHSVEEKYGEDFSNAGDQIGVSTNDSAKRVLLMGEYCAPKKYQEGAEGDCSANFPVGCVGPEGHGCEWKKNALEQLRGLKPGQPWLQNEISSHVCTDAKGGTIQGCCSPSGIPPPDPKLGCYQGVTVCDPKKGIGCDKDGQCYVPSGRDIVTQEQCTSAPSPSPMTFHPAVCGSDTGSCNNHSLIVFGYVKPGDYEVGFFPKGLGKLENVGSVPSWMGTGPVTQLLWNSLVGGDKNEGFVKVTLGNTNKATNRINMIVKSAGGKSTYPLVRFSDNQSYRSSTVAWDDVTFWYQLFSPSGLSVTFSKLD